MLQPHVCERGDGRRKEGERGVKLAISLIWQWSGPGSTLRERGASPVGCDSRLAVTTTSAVSMTGLLRFSCTIWTNWRPTASLSSSLSNTVQERL